MEQVFSQEITAPTGHMERGNRKALMFLESKEAVGLEQWLDAFRRYFYNLELDNTKSKN